MLSRGETRLTTTRKEFNKSEKCRPYSHRVAPALRSIKGQLSSQAKPSQQSKQVQDDLMATES